MIVKLFVLGLIYLRDTHGYEIKEIAKLWGVERWARIGFGSIYHALGKAQEDGLIVELRLEQEGNRPQRTVYRITKAGEVAFFALLRETCRTADPESRDIDMALAFIDQLSPDERVSLLEERLRGLEPRYTSLQDSVERFDRARDSDDPAFGYQRELIQQIPWVDASVRHSLGRVAFEREWLQGVITQVATWPRRPRDNQQPTENRDNVA